MAVTGDFRRKRSPFSCNLRHRASRCPAVHWLAGHLRCRLEPPQASTGRRRCSTLPHLSARLRVSFRLRWAGDLRSALPLLIPVCNRFLNMGGLIARFGRSPALKRYDRSVALIGVLRPSTREGPEWIVEPPSSVGGDNSAIPDPTQTFQTNVRQTQIQVWMRGCACSFR